MTKTRVIQICALLFVIFAAGIIVGIVVAPRVRPGEATAQRPPPPTPEQRIETRITEFNQRLKLTADQQKSIRSLLSGHMSEAQRLNAGRRRRGRELFEKTSAEVRKQLTPEQQAEYDKMLKEVGRLRPDAAQE